LDLDAVGYIIVGAPFQQAGDSVADLLFLAAQRVLAGVSIFYPAPGSRDYSRCKALGVLPRHWSLMRSTALPVSHTTTREESITLLRLGRVLNFMKSLVDRGVDPASDPPEGSPAGIMLENRTQTGMHLLERFLSDGKIRGVDDGGRVFEHVIAPQLTTSFLSGLRQIALRGIRKHGNQNR
jgi:hypothetical protein